MSENFLTYTKVDPSNWLTVTAQKVTFTSMGNNATTYLYKDMGVGGITGSYSYNINTILNGTPSSSGQATVWAISNTLGDDAGIFAVGHSHVVKWSSASGLIYLEEYLNPSTPYAASYTPGLNKEVFLTVSRNTSVGTYGTLYLYIYADEDRTILTTTLSVTLHENINYRYIYGCAGNNTSTAGQSISGYNKSPFAGIIASSF
jgi:hypothetical protein